MKFSTIAIVGSRSFNDYPLAFKETDEFINEYTIEYGTPVQSVVSGGANGADLFGKKYARAKKFGYKEYTPDWNNYGKSAGMIRNKDIIRDADCAIVFWDGESKGTKNSIEHIMSRGIPYKIVRYCKNSMDEWDI